MTHDEWVQRESDPLIEGSLFTMQKLEATEIQLPYECIGESFCEENFYKGL